MSIQEFELKLNKLEDEVLKETLRVLFLTDPEKAKRIAFLERSKIISKEHKSLYDKLSKL